MYAEGDDVPENDVEAVKWYRLAAEQGNVIAQYNLGNMYREGKGTLQNYAKALKLYRLAAEQGVVDAQFNLGLMYGKGEGAPQSINKAYAWMSIAASQGAEDAGMLKDLFDESLTADQITRGQELTARCFKSDYKDCD
jgi:uncharacterized protein